MGETVDVWNIFLHDKIIILEYFLGKKKDDDRNNW